MRLVLGMVLLVAAGLLLGNTILFAKSLSPLLSRSSSSPSGWTFAGVRVVILDKNQRTNYDNDEKENDSDPSESVRSRVANRSFARELRPCNVNIAFLGDSVSRFVYVSLAYFLYTGSWPSLSATRPQCSLAFAKDCPGANNWQTFYEISNAMLGGAGSHVEGGNNATVNIREVCDCHRGEYDSRYFYDPIRNNRLSFFMRGGHDMKVAPFRGRLNSSTIWRQLQQGEFESGLPPFFWKSHSGSQDDDDDDATKNIMMTDPNGGPHLWQHFDWAEMIRMQLGQMQPRPDSIVLNAGLWNNRFGTDAAIRRNVSQAAQEIGAVAYWRTSTAELPGVTLGANRTMYRYNDTDHIMCTFLQNRCIDAHSFTLLAHPSYWADYRHFFEPVNRLIGEATLDALGYLPPDYPRLDPSVLTHPVL